MGLKTYDPSQVAITIGTNIIDNWNTVTVAREERSWNFKAGTKGETTRSKNLNKIGTFTIVMDSSSADNDVLSALETAGTIQSCAVIDKGGTSVALMPEGTVEGPPDDEKGKESGENEWVMKGKIPDPLLVGGNS